MQNETRTVPSCRNCTKWKVCMERSREIPCMLYSNNDSQLKKIREQLKALAQTAEEEESEKG